MALKLMLRKALSGLFDNPIRLEEWTQRALYIAIVLGLAVIVSGLTLGRDSWVAWGLYNAFVLAVVLWAVLERCLRWLRAGRS